MTSKALSDRFDTSGERFSDDLRLRLRRAISWVERAERENNDVDAAFVFYWIAFNAMYASDHADGYERAESESRNRFLGNVVELDRDNRMQPIIWQRLAEPIRLLVNNRYVFQPFWKHYNLVDGYDDWAERFERSKEIAATALAQRDTLATLRIVFDRLYVLRNQLLHGGATWNGSVNRRQVQDGALTMAFLSPLFIMLMMDNPSVSWGPPHYPPDGRQQH